MLQEEKDDDELFLVGPWSMNNYYSGLLVLHMLSCFFNYI
jgi:hypothetical protein